MLKNNGNAESHAAHPGLMRWIQALSLLFVLSIAHMHSAHAQSNCVTTARPPGFAYSMIDWRIIKKGLLPQTYGMLMTEDALSIQVEDGARLGVASNQMQITLVTNLTWGKEVVPWNPTALHLWGSRIGNGAGVPATIRLTRGACSSSAQTIVLRKAKFLGVMTDVYHFDPASFWHLWGGKSITIRWVADSNVAGPYPPPCALGCVPLGGVVRGQLADRAVYRPASGEWLFDNAFPPVPIQWGAPGDIPVRGFFDVDRFADITVWRPSNGTWFIINSLDGQTQTKQWGQGGDIPVPGDYDGDGRTDFAVWRPSNGFWFVRRNVTDFVQSQQWGQNGDVPVPADYDGDMRTDFAIWRPASGDWWVINSSNGGISRQQWGQPGDVPVVADYDGDTKADFAIWRPSSGHWWIINSSTGAMMGRQWGMAGDIPVAGDYDHDGRADMAVWRPSGAMWHVIYSSGPITSRPFGASTDIPLKPSL